MAKSGFFVEKLSLQDENNIAILMFTSNNPALNHPGMKFAENFPMIETDRFVLRQITDDDLQNVFKGLSHPDVIRYYGVSFDTLEDTKEQMTWFKNLEKEGRGIWWAICRKDSQCFCGAGGLNDLDKINQKAEIGFWLLPEYWGKGIMKEVLPQICRFGFEKLQLHRIEGLVDTDNTICKKAISGMGFTHEGTMKDCEIKNGKFISLDIYAKIKTKVYKVQV